jgi:hypothetical protein
MNLQNLTDAKLISETDAAVATEMAATLAVLHHFREIERRRLFSDLGYKSLFDMSVKRYGFSEYQTLTRIDAMRLLRELPQIEAQIQSGELNLTNLSTAQTLFKQERKLGNPYAAVQKLQVLEQITGKSTREAQRITLSLSSQPETLRPDRVQQVTETTVELKFTVDESVAEQLKALRSELAHALPNATLGELVKYLLNHRAPKKSRVINKYCEICSSTHALEVDHIKPRALGGSDEPENLRVLCRSCNQRAAVRVFGAPKMQRYFN